MKHIERIITSEGGSMAKPTNEGIAPDWDLVNNGFSGG